MYTFMKVADNFTNLTNTEKEKLFENYEQAEASDLYNLGKFKIAVFSEDESQLATKAEITAVPNDILCLPKTLFGDSFNKINNISIVDTVSDTLNSKIVYFITKDLTDYYTFSNGKFVKLSSMDVATVLNEGIDSSKLGAITPTQWATFYDGANDTDGIGIGFAISQTASTQKLNVDKLAVSIDIRGSWSKAIAGTDYSYGYTGNSTLKFDILVDGDYKINYQLNASPIK